MKKIKKRHLNLFMIFCLCQNIVFSQSKTGVENYNMLSRGESYVWMPVMHYQSEKGAYAELRYNYEEMNTLSLYGGKTFGGGKKLNYSFTPMIGISFGEFDGISLATNAELEWKNFYISSQSQFSKTSSVNQQDFFFTWSELGYDFTKYFYGGFAIQFTRQQGINDSEPGVVIGFIFKDISIPIYAFNPLGTKAYFILGLNYEFKFSSKK